MRREGFTLIELLVIFVIVGILATIAIPGFSNLLPNYRLRSAARDLFSNFQLAKFTSIKRNSYCAVTFGQDIGGTTYDYIVYVDSNSDLVYDAGEDIVTKVLFSERYPGVDFDTTQGGGDGLTFPPNAVPLPSIAFTPNGLPRDNVGNPGAGTAFFINTKNGTATVVVTASGNITVQ